MGETADVDAYIDAAAPEARPLLRDLRRLVLAAAPSVAERISYGMPAYEYRGRRLVHFSAARSHVGVYGLVHVDATIPGQLAEFVDHRSTLRFLFDRPLPTAALTASLEQKIRALDGV